ATGSRAGPPRADCQTGPGGRRFERLRPTATVSPLAISPRPRTGSIQPGLPAPVGGVGTPVDVVVGVGVADDVLGVGVGVATAPVVHAPTGGLTTLLSNEIGK